MLVSVFTGKGRSPWTCGRNARGGDGECAAEANKQNKTTGESMGHGHAAGMRLNCVTYQDDVLALIGRIDLVENSKKLGELRRVRIESRRL